jgi:hypothetical protein
VIDQARTLSLFTAVPLEGVPEIVAAAKNWVKARFRAAPTPIGTAVAAVMLVTDCWLPSDRARIEYALPIYMITVAR